MTYRPPTHGISTAYPWYIETPTHGILTPNQWYIDLTTHGILTTLPMVYRLT